jgi:hypothetical protein
MLSLCPCQTPGQCSEQAVRSGLGRPLAGRPQIRRLPSTENAVAGSTFTVLVLHALGLKRTCAMVIGNVFKC